MLDGSLSGVDAFIKPRPNSTKEEHFNDDTPFPESLSPRPLMVGYYEEAKLRQQSETRITDTAR
jgi:hypothetical protein